ncbi:hypothetical protein KI387_044493, partial [Taxus chinensis]
MIISQDEARTPKEFIHEPNVNWTLEFDGSCSSTGSGAGVVLTSLEGNIHPFSFKLYFENMNNTAEYEALILGLSMEKEMGVKNLCARGDAELIVKQVIDIFQVKNRRLKHYRNLFWDSIEFLDAFSIEVMPRERNTRSNSLVVSGSLLIPHPNFSQEKFTIEMIHRKNIPDNVNNWKVFNDDQHLLSFLELRDNFDQLYFEGSDTFLRECVSSDEGDIKEEMNQDGCIKLKGNKIPKGLVSLENLFDKHDRYIKSKTSQGAQKSTKCENFNIGSLHEPKMVNIGKCCTLEEKKKVVNLLK